MFLIYIIYLDHVVSLRSEAGDVSVNVDRLFVPHTFDHRVDDDEAAGAANAGAAVHNDGPCVGRVERLDSLQEHEEGRRVLWYAVVRPRRELQLTHLSSL